MFQAYLSTIDPTKHTQLQLLKAEDKVKPGENISAYADLAYNGMQ